MKSLKSSLATAFIALLIPMLYLAKEYKKMPIMVPTHFGFDGKPDDYSQKSTLIIILSLLSFLAIGIFYLLRNIHKIDPKKNARTMPGTMNKMALAIVIFISLLNTMIVSSSINGNFGNGKVIFCIIGFFLAYIGNLMYSTKPNYFIGIRTPWTLENEDNWRKTHQLAGKIWFAGGLFIAVFSIFIGDQLLPYLFISMIGCMTLIPMVYSFILFKKNQQN